MWDEEVSEGGPRGDHNPPGHAWGAWHAQVGCAHLVHLPLMFIAQKIPEYSQKKCIKFSGHSENFYFGSFFIAREI